jgi:ribosome-binding protein aMBF1 (putative translation factor)
LDQDNFAKRLQDAIKAKYGARVSAARIARDLEHASKFQIEVTSEGVRKWLLGSSIPRAQTVAHLEVMLGTHLVFGYQVSQFADMTKAELIACREQIDQALKAKAEVA